MNDVTLIINSCDAYEDLWDPFFKLLSINWPESRDYRVLVNTETKKTSKYGSNVCFVNSDSADMRWGKRLLRCLEQVLTDYVIVLMDDFFLREPVSVDRLQYTIRTLGENRDIACFYLAKTIKGDLPPSDYIGFSEIKSGMLYRLNTAPGLWRKEYLIKYLRDYDDPWTWEFFGGNRVREADTKFYMVSGESKALYDYAHVVYRGKWRETELAPLASKYELNISKGTRGVILDEQEMPSRSLIWKLAFVGKGIRISGIGAIHPLLTATLLRKNENNA